MAVPKGTSCGPAMPRRETARAPAYTGLNFPSKTPSLVTNVRIEPTVLAGLKALAAERGVPIWRVMTEAGEKLIRSAKR